mmetsp:Transcript_20959/g.37859  ORF Transcript_20959/g.37859 Transcript_20959/m.37859 type:complete len:267 (+) Transcript_20959:353-1153(+)
MRCQNHICQSIKGTVLWKSGGWRRTLSEYVQGGAGNGLVLECLDQCRLVNDGTTCGIDQKGCWFHFGNGRGIDQMFGRLIERTMDRDKIGTCHEIVHGDDRDDIFFRIRRRRRKRSQRVGGARNKDVHAQCVTDGSDAFANGSQSSNETNCFVGEFEMRQGSQMTLGQVGTVSGGQGLGLRNQGTTEGHDKGNGHVRHGVRRIGGHIAHLDIFFVRRDQINIVVSRARLTNESDRRRKGPNQIPSQRHFLIDHHLMPLHSLQHLFF